MTEHRTTSGPHLVANEYLQLMFKLHVPVKPGTVVLLTECTRCGGAHQLSQCRWPPIETENKEVS